VDLRVVRAEVESGVALVTLDRPDRLNAWTSRMEHEFRWVLDGADRDPAVGVVVVTGAGRGFCAGADFRALDKMVDAGQYVANAPDAPVDFSRLGAAFDHAVGFMLGLSKPVIAAINGPAAGVGFVLACFADIRFAAEGAKLTTSFGRLGLPAEHGVSWVLSRILGTARAADLLLSSRVVLAEEAAALGLVNRVLPRAELLPFTLDYARSMARDISPESLRVMKRQLYEDLSRDLAAAVRVAEEETERMITGDEFREGAAAMQEKRSPRWR
jgi:enoyl-CoA hydratase/carnithine racemase